jgi:hypothetical protein
MYVGPGESFVLFATLKTAAISVCARDAVRA